MTSFNLSTPVCIVLPLSKFDPDVTFDLFSHLFEFFYFLLFFLSIYLIIYQSSMCTNWVSYLLIFLVICLMEGFYFRDSHIRNFSQSKAKGRIGSKYSHSISMAQQIHDNIQVYNYDKQIANIKSGLCFLTVLFFKSYLHANMRKIQSNTVHKINKYKWKINKTCC